MLTIQGVIGTHAWNNGVENDFCNEVIDRKLKFEMSVKSLQTRYLKLYDNRSCMSASKLAI